jgi:hypothetical protein
MFLNPLPVPDPTRRTRQRDIPATADEDAPDDEGCPFRPRCAHAREVCAGPLPIHPTPTGIVACHRHPDLPRDDLHRRTRPGTGTHATSTAFRP